jgi:RecA-family ATPase
LSNLQFWFPEDVGGCLLATQTPGGAIQPTALFQAIATRINSDRPALVIVDNVAAIYGGDQNNRGQVRAFMNLWRGLARSSGAAILLLNHPSLSGLTNGTGRGGSMAVFEAAPENGGYKARAFAATMHRLLNAGRIEIREEGPPSKRRKRLAIAANGSAS